MKDREPKKTKQLCSQHCSELMETVLMVLSSRERKVMELRHGIGVGNRRHTFEEIAKMLKLKSSTHAGQIESSAYAKLFM